MIEIIETAKCTACNICVLACPTNVFEIVRGQPPRIARQKDCQSCFMCELYCPEDALYVAPNPDPVAQLDTATPAVSSLLGTYRAAVGWGKGQQSTASDDPTYELLLRAH
ncbi:MAG: ferredoxin family protein [Burkholderiaceae bacterium]|jgi:NAD-dependent dihydropyrimidine dehydrogenase PreA subunit|nr:ferredoxin family protein [Burkholderiaceae bacterium]